MQGAGWTPVVPDVFTIDRAYDAIEASEDHVAPHIEHFEDNTRELCGRFYFEDDGIRRPLNLISRNCLTLLAHLAHRNPRHMVTPKSVALKGSADTRALLLDTVSEDLDRLTITRLQLLRAFLGPMAVTKVGARVGGDLVKVNGRLYDRGMPYIQAIDISDHLADHEARCRDELTWEGHRYRVPKAMAQECGLFNPDVIESMPDVSERVGGDRTTARPEMISKRNAIPGNEAVPMVELIDLIIYDDQEPLIITLPAQRGYADDFLRVEPWEGPTRGPYEWLQFYPIPNQLYGMSLVAFMREQHDAVNELFAKMLDQMLRTKRLVIGPRASSDDLDTARDSEDGDVIEFDDPTQVKNLDIGGLTPDFAPFSQQLQGWANMQLVNIDIASGQSGGTDKATIYQGQSANVSAMIDDLQNTHEAHETRVSRQLDWRLQMDPLLQKRLVRRLPGQEMIEVVYNAQDRRDDFDQMTVEIRYGSMLRQDPQVKANNLIQLLDVAMRSIQVTMQSGGAWSTQGALRLAGQYLGFDEIDELVNDPQLEMALQQMLMQTAGMPTQGQAVGMSQVNPRSLSLTRPQPRSAGLGRGFARPQLNGAPRRQLAGAVA